MFKSYGTALLLFSSLAWGSAYISMAYAFNNGVGVYTLLGVRFLFGGFILSLLYFKDVKKITKNEVKICIISSLLIFVMFSGMSYSLLFISSSKSSAIFSLYIIFVLLTKRLLGKIKLNALSIGYSTFITLGIFYINKNGIFSEGIGIGDIYSLIGGISFALNTVYLEENSKQISHTKLSIIQMIICGLLSIIFAIGFDEKLFSLTNKLVFNLIYLSVVVTAFAYMAQNHAMKVVTAEKASVILSCQSIFTILISIVILGEIITKNIVIGILLILMGVITYGVSATTKGYSILSKDT